MTELTLTERTEPFTLEEVFDFIDDTNIDKTSAHELKSRIADVIMNDRIETVDYILKEFREQFEKAMDDGYEDMVNWADWLDEIAEQMKGV